MVEATGGEGVHVPHSHAVDAGVEHEGCIDVPITVDILRLSGAPTRIGIVCHLIRYAVARVGVVEEGHYSALVALLISVVEQSQTVGEGRLQSRITHLHVQRVAVVHDVEQVRHTRLRGRSAIVEPQVRLLAYLVAEVQRRTPVHHIALHVDMRAEIVLLIARMLRLQHHSHVQPVVLLVHAQHHLGIVSVCAILRIAAQVVVFIRLDGLRQQRQIAVPSAILGSDAREISLSQVREIVGRAVALVEAVGVFVAELQVGAARNRLAVGSLHRIGVALGWHQVVAVCLIALVEQVEMHILQRQRGRLAVLEAHFSAQRHVASALA